MSLTSAPFMPLSLRLELMSCSLMWRCVISTSIAAMSPVVVISIPAAILRTAFSLVFNGLPFEFSSSRYISMVGVLGTLRASTISMILGKP